MNQVTHFYNRCPVKIRLGNAVIHLYIRQIISVSILFNLKLIYAFLTRNHLPKMNTQPYRVSTALIFKQFKMKKYLFLPAILSTTIWFSCSYEENEPEAEKSYTKSIERISSGSFEAGLIETAETVYPPRQDVIQAAGTWTEVPVSGYWYYNSFDGVYIPYAITSDAINYYSGLIEQFNQEPEGNFFLTADFRHQATVSFKENYQSPALNSLGEPLIPQEYENVYVVEMKLEWEQYCGSLCAMWIDKERIVIFNKSGGLLDIFLDGPVSVPVS